MYTWRTQPDQYNFANTETEVYTTGGRMEDHGLD